jgi:hypothetical protein
MDAETIDAYVAATMSDSLTVLFEALRRLARSHGGPFRPSPADVIDRCYEVHKERRQHADEALRLEGPRLENIPGSDLLAVWDRCIARGLAEGYSEDSIRIKFWRRGRARLATRLLQRAGMTPDDLLGGLIQ